MMIVFFKIFFFFSPSLQRERERKERERKKKKRERRRESIPSRKSGNHFLPSFLIFFRKKNWENLTFEERERKVEKGRRRNREKKQGRDSFSFLYEGTNLNFFSFKISHLLSFLSLFSVFLFSLFLFHIFSPSLSFRVRATRHFFIPLTLTLTGT